MRIVVTGPAGLVGRHLLPALAPVHDVWALARRVPQTPPSGARWIEADLAAPVLPAELPETADVVIHLAQSPRYAEFPEGALDVFNVNVASTARLLDWSRRAGVRQFIMASSGAVGATGSGLSFYAATKQSAELLAAPFSRHLAVLVVRFFFVYGPGQRASMLVPRLIRAIRAHEPVVLAGTDGPRLNPVHVDDAVRALVSGVNRLESGQCDVAGPDVLTVRQMGECIASRLGTTPRFTSDPGQVAPDMVGNVGAMCERLAPPRLSFRAGVDQVVTAMDEAGAS